MTEIYKIRNDVGPPKMKSLFQFRLNQYNLRNFQELSTEKRNMVSYGLGTLTYRAPAIWAKLLSKCVLAASSDEFKSSDASPSSDEFLDCISFINIIRILFFTLKQEFICLRILYIHNIC